MAGVVSRDGKYLAAIVSEDPYSICQAWFDCLHNNSFWLPEDVPPEKRTWRLTIYVMENDPAGLMKKALEDYPKLRPAPVTADPPAAAK